MATNYDASPIATRAIINGVEALWANHCPPTILAGLYTVHEAPGEELDVDFALPAVFDVIPTAHSVAKGATIKTGGKARITKDIYTNHLTENGRIVRPGTNPFNQGIANSPKKVQNNMNEQVRSSIQAACAKFNVVSLQTVHGTIEINTGSGMTSTTWENRPGYIPATNFDFSSETESVKKGAIVYEALIENSVSMTTNSVPGTIIVQLPSEVYLFLRVYAKAIGQMNEIKVQLPGLAGARVQNMLFLDGSIMVIPMPKSSFNASGDPIQYEIPMTFQGGVTLAITKADDVYPGNPGLTVMQAERNLGRPGSMDERTNPLGQLKIEDVYLNELKSLINKQGISNIDGMEDLLGANFFDHDGDIDGGSSWSIAMIMGGTIIQAAKSRKIKWITDETAFDSEKQYLVKNYDVLTAPVNYHPIIENARDRYNLIRDSRKLVNSDEYKQREMSRMDTDLTNLKKIILENNLKEDLKIDLKKK